MAVQYAANVQQEISIDQDHHNGPSMGGSIAGSINSRNTENNQSRNEHQGMTMMGEGMNTHH